MVPAAAPIKAMATMIVDSSGMGVGSVVPIGVKTGW